jgi:hypothetical protein
MHLSVLVPGIRTYNWKTLYDSIGQSTKRSWEIIFVGPYGVPAELSDKSNIKYIQDFGTPIRCQQIALLHAEGDWITWAADDGYFLDRALDIGSDILDKRDNDSNIVVAGKYYEGDQNHSEMASTDYYMLSYHACTRSRFVPEHYLTLNVGLVSRSLLTEIGGWDCCFEVCPMSHADAAIRMQRYGAEFIVQDDVMFKCSHMPNITGDHGPIHYAQTQHDEPLYRKIYNDDSCIDRIVVDLNSWKSQPEKWSRRFA